MGRSCPAGLHELLQGVAVGGQCPLQERHGFNRREPVGLEARRPRQFGLVSTQVTHRHGGQTVAKGRVGQQGIAKLVSGFIQRFQALDNRRAIGAGQRAQRADAFTLDRTVDDHDQVLAGRAKVTDHLPDGVSRCVDYDRAGYVHIATLTTCVIGMRPIATRTESTLLSYAHSLRGDRHKLI